MARLSRLSLPGRLHHILQRGNNRQAVVLDDEDRAALLQALRDEAAQAQVAVHAYVLMDNQSRTRGNCRKCWGATPSGAISARWLA